MQRTERKHPRLKDRAEALERELARMDEDIRALSKAAAHPDRDSALRRLQRFSVQKDRAREIQSSRMSGRMEGGSREPSSESHPGDPQQPGVSGMATPGAVPPGGTDPRFAQYFVTGSLHSIQPLRQERRVQRNKALIMLFFAIVLLYGVFNLIF
jgi:hypothetical protein